MNNRKIESKLNERLSAFLDGETSSDEAHALLDCLLQDPQLQQVLSQHQRLRASLHGELHPGLDDDFATRVMASIEQAESRHSGKVVTLKVPRLRPVLRTAVGMAMAASFAAVAVLGVQMLLPSSDTAFPALTTAEIPASTPAPAGTVALAADIDSGQQWDGLSPDAAAELNNYLISHNNSAIDHGLNGTLGFMRVAADDGLGFFRD